MPVRHSWGDHVGELELRLEADDEPGVFAAALGAMEELLGDDGGRDAQEWFEVAAAGADRAGLLAAWLEDAGITVRSPSNKGLAEEAPFAHKDVERVVDVVERAGLAIRVAQLRPIGVVKG